VADGPALEGFPLRPDPRTGKERRITNAEKILDRAYRNAVTQAEKYDSDAKVWGAQLREAEAARDRYLAEAEDLAAYFDTLRGRA